MKYLFKVKWINIFLVAILIINLVSSFIRTNVSASGNNNNIPVQFLSLNDFHSSIAGAEYLATNLDTATQAFLTTNNLAAGANNSIRVLAGDMVGGSAPAMSGLLRHEPTIKVLNRMNFTVGTLGNHEFDYGLAEFHRILQGKSTDVFGSVVANYPREASNLEVLAANVIDTTTGKAPFGFEPYTIRNMGGVDVGFIGLLMEDAENYVLPKYRENYQFLNEAETIAKYAQKLRAQDVHAIVVLIHNASTMIDDIMAEVEKIDPDHSVDIIFSGHDHQIQSATASGAVVVQAKSYGSHFGNVIGALDPDTKDFVTQPLVEVVPKTTAGVVINHEIKAIVDDARTRVQSILDEVIGFSSQEIISRQINEHKESALGNFITDVMRTMANRENMNVDFSFTNHDGLSTDLVGIAAGDGKYGVQGGNILSILPFGNTVQIIDISGAAILEAFTQEEDPKGGPFYLQTSGLTYYKVEKKATINGVADGVAVLPDGSLIDPNKIYRIAINDFVHTGGRYPAFSKGTLVAEIGQDSEIIAEYIKSLATDNKSIAAVIEGRRQHVTVERLAAIRNGDLDENPEEHPAIDDKDGNKLGNGDEPSDRTAVPDPKLTLPTTGHLKNSGYMLGMLFLSLGTIVALSRRRKSHIRK